MVGEYSDADGLVPGAYLFIYRSDEALVEVFNGLELQFEVAVVAGFVAGFNVNEDEVVVTKGIDGGLCLPLVVGVGKACGTFYLDNLQAGIVTDTADKVDGGDDRSTLDLGVLSAWRDGSRRSRARCCWLGARRGRLWPGCRDAWPAVPAISESGRLSGRQFPVLSYGPAQRERSPQPLPGVGATTR